MSAISDSLETQITAIQGLMAQQMDDGGNTLPARYRAHLDRHYRILLDLLAPRIRYFTRQYGLTDMADDAHQACSIAIHRAVGEYDAAKARFTTFVNWKIRGELQGLRHRMRLDQRSGAKAVGARTLSLDMLASVDSDEGHGQTFTIVDDDAWERVETGAADRMARQFTGAVLDDYFGDAREKALAKAARSRIPVKPGTIGPGQVEAIEAKLRRERSIVASHLTGAPDTEDDGSMTSEQIRQVTRRVLRHVGARVRSEPRYAAAMGTVH